MSNALTIQDKDPNWGFPASLPMEIAAKTGTIKAICESYGISRDRWEALRVNPVFIQACDEAARTVASEGGAFRLKAKTMAEALLPRMFNLANSEDPDVPASVRADLFKATVRIAGLDASIEQKGAAAGKAIAQNPLMIQINLR